MAKRAGLLLPLFGEDVGRGDTVTKTASANEKGASTAQGQNHMRVTDL